MRIVATLLITFIWAIPGCNQYGLCDQAALACQAAQGSPSRVTRENLPDMWSRGVSQSDQVVSQRGQQRTWPLGIGKKMLLSGCAEVIQSA